MGCLLLDWTAGWYCRPRPVTSASVARPRVSVALPRTLSSVRGSLRSTGASLRAIGTCLLAAALVSPMAAAAATNQRAAVPRFVDEALSAGVEHVYDGDWQYFVGGGVATFDCDEDGRLDLYFAGGSKPAALFRNDSPDGGALRFEPVASDAADLEGVVGAYPLDIDSDGHLDLAVLRHGEDVLLRGLGDCRFERANEAWGFDGGDAWTTAFSATWEPGNDWPTLAFGTYIDHTDDQGISTCGLGSLLRPAEGGGGFAPAVPLEPGDCALSMLFSDWSHTGQRDLRVSNDRHYYYEDGEEQLWRMTPGEAPALYTRDDGWKHLQLYGMGIASQDLTGDGIPEIYLTTIGSNQLESLVGGPGQPTYKDIAHDLGVGVTTPVIGRPINPSTSWHPEFDDVNNDGRMDLFVSKGNVDAVPDNAAEDPNELLIAQPDGTFRRSTKPAGILDTLRTRGAALVDLNADGLLDLVEVHRTENVSVRRNVGGGSADQPEAMGHWLGVKLEQEGANRDAVGSWIEVDVAGKPTVREVTVGGGHASGELGPIHFGLGKSDAARVRVTWPDGTQGPWHDVAVDQVMTLDRAGETAVVNGPA
jgi:enediyne biosynthesis protein E4